MLFYWSALCCRNEVSAVVLGSGMLVINLLKVQLWQTNGVDIVCGQPTYSDVMNRDSLVLMQNLYG